MPSQPRIAIVGGGPGGLTLGVLLHNQGIPFTIFELREKPTEDEMAQPSGMLDLHHGSGLDAIEACGLTAAFQPLTGECSEDFLIADRDGTILLPANGKGQRPEISRNNLGKLLRGPLPPESIQWDHRLVSATRTASGETDLDFGAHGKHTFDLVVGADGAWSKVREQLLPDMPKPQFTGMHCITVTIRNVTSKHPQLAALVGTGSFCALGQKHSVVSQRGPIDSARLYLWLTVPGNDEQFNVTAGLEGKPATHAKDVLLKNNALLGTFGATIKELVATACDEDAADHPDESLDIRPFYTLPHGAYWKPKSGVTLVGDAAHLMLPNGEGVNMAMLDALLLSQAIIQAYEATGSTGNENGNGFVHTLDPLVRRFEAAMVQRAVETGKETDGLIGKMFGSDNAAYDLISFFQSMAEGKQ